MLRGESKKAALADTSDARAEHGTAVSASHAIKCCSSLKNRTTHCAEISFPDVEGSADAVCLFRLWSRSRRCREK